MIHNILILTISVYRDIIYDILYIDNQKILKMHNIDATLMSD